MTPQATKIEEAPHRDPGVQSLSRALDLLEAFLSQSPEIGLSRLAALGGVNKATAHRLLTTLEARNYLQRCPESRKYRLGVRLFELGARFQNQLDIRRIALPELTSLVEQTGQAGFLCIRDGDNALCLERVSGRHRVRIFALEVGERQSLHCGAAPRALLSGMSDADVIAYAARTGLPRLTPQTIGTQAQLLEDVHRTQRQGYVVSNQDVSTGIAAVGSPVWDHSRRVAASISLSGLAAMYTPGRVTELAGAVQAAAHRLSQAMGYRAG